MVKSSQAEPPNEGDQSDKTTSQKLETKLDHLHLSPALDPEAATGGKSFGEVKRPPALRSLRFYVMAIALISPFVTTYSRTIINFAITDMIDPEMVEVKQGQSKTLLSNETQVPYFDLDHSCPVTEEEDRQRLLNEVKSDTQRAINIPGEKYKWDTFKQGLLKAAFSIGHTPFAIPGSRLGEMYGSVKVLGFCSVLITICCLSAPFLAAIHFYLIFFDLILLGIWGSFMTPALITLFVNWLTPSEKSIMMSFYLVTSRLGYALSSMLCGILIEANYSWRNVFFSAGWISLTFAVLIFTGTRSRPIDHPLISVQELEYLATKNTLVKEALDESRKQHIQECELNEVGNDNAHQKQGQQSAPAIAKDPPTGAPWFAILTNVPVLAFVVTKFCVKLSGDVAAIELPSYLKRVMHFSAKRNGMVNASNYIIFCGGCAMIGILSTWFNKVKPFGLGKKASRKIFQSVASFGVALCLIGIAFSVCHDTPTQIFLLLQFFVTTFGIGGEAQMPIDLTERYSGTIHALGSSIAISGIIAPTLVGYLLQGHSADRDSWKSVWLGASAIAVIGGLTFLIFGDAKIQPFDKIEATKLNGKQLDASEKLSNHENGKDNGAFEKEVDNNPTIISSQNGSKPHRESIEI